MVEVDFIFDNQLINEIELLIKKSKTELLLISPFIDLDERIKSALNGKKGNYKFKLKVLFGKNEHNVYKSVKKDSFDFLKEFPNIEIKYNHRLHAKFYQSETTYILTSMNLYDYSLAKNIEAGIVCNFGYSGILGKAIDGATNTINSGVDKVKHDVLGFTKEVDPIEEFNKIFKESELVYQTEPIIEKEKGVAGIIGVKKLVNKRIVADNFNRFNEKDLVSKATVKKPKSLSPLKTTKSASQIAKELGVSQKDLTSFMEKIGYIKSDLITDKGKKRGLEMKKYMGREYIAYPIDLDELKNLKAKNSST